MELLGVTAGRTTGHTVIPCSTPAVFHAPGKGTPAAPTPTVGLQSLETDWQLISVVCPSVWDALFWNPWAGVPLGR